MSPVHASIDRPTRALKPPSVIYLSCKDDINLKIEHLLVFFHCIQCWLIHELNILVCRESSSVTMSVNNRSEITRGSYVSWVTNEMLAAKPTSCSVGSLSPLPWK